MARSEPCTEASAARRVGTIKGQSAVRWRVVHILDAQVKAKYFNHFPFRTQYSFCFYFQFPVRDAHESIKELRSGVCFEYICLLFPRPSFLLVQPLELR